MNNNSIIRGIFNYSISSWINIVIGFVSVIFMTRIISPEIYGNISIFLASSNLLMYLMTIGLDGAYIRFFNEPPNGNTRNQLLYKNLIYTTIIGFIFVGLAHILGDDLSGLVFGISSKELLLFAVLYAYALSFFRFLNITYRMSFKSIAYNIQNIVMNSLARVLIILAGLWFFDTMSIIKIMSFGTLFAMMLYIVIQYKEIIPKNSKGKVDISIDLVGYLSYIRFAIFNAPSYFVTYFNTFFVQNTIKKNLGDYCLGLYSSCGMFKTILSGLQGGFATYWTAYVYKNYAIENEKIKNMHEYILLFSIIVSSCMVAFRDFIYIVIGKEYHDSKQFFSILLIPPVLSLIRETTDKGIAIAKKNEIILVSNTIAMLITMSCCVLFAIYGNIRGVAVAECVGAIILYIIITYYGQKYYPSIPNIKRSVFIVVLVVAVLIIPSFINDIKIILIITFTIDIVAIFILKKQVKNVINFVSNNMKRLICKK